MVNNFYERKDGYVVLFCNCCRSQKLFKYKVRFGFYYCLTCGNGFDPFTDYYGSLFDGNVIACLECGVDFNPELLICTDCNRFTICRDLYVFDDLMDSGMNKRLF